MHLINSSLKPYRTQRFSNQQVVIPSTIIISLDSKKCKWFYVKLLKQFALEGKAMGRWSNYVGTNIDWCHVYKNKMCNNLEIKHNDFNFKMLNNILATRDNLYRWKKTPENSCLYCNTPAV